MCRKTSGSAQKRSRGTAQVAGGPQKWAPNATSTPEDDLKFPHHTQTGPDFQGLSEWARLGSNQRPLACEAVARISSNRREPRFYGGLDGIRCSSDVCRSTRICADNGRRSRRVPLRSAVGDRPERRSEVQASTDATGAMSGRKPRGSSPLSNHGTERQMAATCSMN